MQAVNSQDLSNDTQPHGADFVQHGWPTDGKFNGYAGVDRPVNLKSDPAAADVHRAPRTKWEGFALPEHLIPQLAPDLKA
jgi:hypothetical protein